MFQQPFSDIEQVFLGLKHCTILWIRWLQEIFGVIALTPGCNASHIEADGLISARELVGSHFSVFLASVIRLPDSGSPGLAKKDLIHGGQAHLALCP